MVEDTDEECVNEMLDIGAYQGWWVPPFFDCQVFADDVLSACNTGSGGGAPFDDDCRSFQCIWRGVAAMMDPLYLPF